MKTIGLRVIFTLTVIFFIVLSCSKDDTEHTVRSSVNISTNFTNGESAGIPGGIARFTIKISNAENFDYLEFHKKTNNIEDESAYIKLTKFDVTYHGNNEFEEVIEYVLKNEDVNKENKVIINVFDSDGSVQKFEYSFLVASKFPDISCAADLTEGIPYEDNLDTTLVNIFLRVPAGFGELTVVKTVDDIIDDSFDVLIDETTIIPVGDNSFEFSFTHNFVEEEVNKEVKYTFHLTDDLGREEDCVVILNTLPPRPIEAGALFIHTPWDLENGYILYSISERKLYRLIDVENDPSLESKIDLVFNNGISFSSPSVSDYTINWSTRNITTFKRTGVSFFDIHIYNAYEIYSFYDESSDSPSLYAGRDFYDEALAFKAEGTNGSEPIQGLFYITEFDYSNYARTGFHIGRKPLD